MIYELLRKNKSDISPKIIYTLHKTIKTSNNSNSSKFYSPASNNNNNSSSNNNNCTDILVNRTT